MMNNYCVLSVILLLCMLLVSRSSVTALECEGYKKPCHGSCVSRRTSCSQRPCRSQYNERWCAHKQTCVYYIFHDCCSEKHCNDGSCRDYGRRCPDETCESMDWLNSKSCKNEDLCYTSYEKCDEKTKCREGTDEEGCPMRTGTFLGVMIGGGLGGTLVIIVVCIICCYKCRKRTTSGTVIRQPNAGSLALQGTAQSQPLNVTAGAPIYTPPGQAPNQASWNTRQQRSWNNTPPQPRSWNSSPATAPPSGGWGSQPSATHQGAGWGAHATPPMQHGQHGRDQPLLTGGSRTASEPVDDSQPPSYQDVMKHQS